MKKAVKSLLSNRRLLAYLVMAIIIVTLELLIFQLIFLLTNQPIVATVLSFIFGVVLNWVFGRKFVFGKSHHDPWKEFSMVFTASVGGVLIQVAIVYISVTFLALYPIVGKAASIVFSFIWNYWFRAQIVYKKR